MQGIIQVSAQIRSLGPCVFSTQIIVVPVVVTLKQGANVVDLADVIEGCLRLDFDQPAHLVLIAPRSPGHVAELVICEAGDVIPKFLVRCSQPRNDIFLRFPRDQAIQCEIIPVSLAVATKVVGIGDPSGTDVNHDLPDGANATWWRGIPVFRADVMQVSQQRMPVIPTEPFFLQNMIKKCGEFTDYRVVDHETSLRMAHEIGCTRLGYTRSATDFILIMGIG